MALNQGHIFKIKAKFLSGHNSLLSCWIWIIFHTIIIHDPRACHDLDSRSYVQGQGHSAHIAKFIVGAITLYCHVVFGWYFTQLLSMTQGCVMTLTKDHIFKVKLGAVVAEWLSSWLAEQEDQGSIPGLATWIFRDWLSPASKSRYDWKIAKSTLILKTTNQPKKSRSSSDCTHCYNPCPGHNSLLSCCIWITFHTIIN